MLKENNLELKNVLSMLQATVHILQIVFGTMAAASVLVSLVVLQKYTSAYHAQWLMISLVDTSFKLILFVFFEIVFLTGLPLFVGLHTSFTISSLSVEKEKNKILINIKNPLLLIFMLFLSMLSAFLIVKNSYFWFIFGISMIIILSLYNFLPPWHSLSNQKRINTKKNYQKSEKNFLILFLTIVNILVYLIYFLYMTHEYSIYFASQKFLGLYIDFIIIFVTNILYIGSYFLGYQVALYFYQEPLHLENGAKILFLAFFALGGLIFLFVSQLPIASEIVRAAGVGGFYARITYQPDHQAFSTKDFLVIADADSTLFVQSKADEKSKLACGRIFRVPMTQVQSITELPGVPKPNCPANVFQHS